MTMYAEHSSLRSLFVRAGLVTVADRRGFVREVVGRDVEPVGRGALSVIETGQVLAALYRRTDETAAETAPASHSCGRQPCPQEWEHARAHAGAEITWRAARGSRGTGRGRGEQYAAERAIDEREAS